MKKRKKRGTYRRRDITSCLRALQAVSRLRAAGLLRVDSTGFRHAHPQYSAAEVAAAIQGRACTPDLALDLESFIDSRLDEGGTSPAITPDGDTQPTEIQHFTDSKDYERPVPPAGLAG